MTKDKHLEVIFATVNDDGSGMHLRLRDNDGNVQVVYTPSEVWGKIPEEMDRKKELQKVANLLNGFEIKPNGQWVPLPNFVPKKITIVKEN